ncbi:MAG: hypothetical protein H6745_17520 [Deltaproteobacteria bacterium]|nr:hypothetical protein [Deltaproteobacteria bacterium]
MTCRVLVFDDELVVHTDFLAHLDADFVYRANADDAVADVEAVRPDIVLMDFSMNAKRSGADAVQILREHYGYDRLPIVAISSDTRLNRKMCMVGATVGIAKMALPVAFDQIVVGVCRRGDATG